MTIYEVVKLKKVILPQGSEHKAAGLHWVVGIGDWVLEYWNPKNPINPKNPTNSIRLPGCQRLSRTQ